jgi:hypothetical protein
VRYAEAGVDVEAGAAAWARGSDNWSDVEIAATLRLGKDAVAASTPGHVSPQSFLRVTVAADGLRVQENLRGRLRTLHWQSDPIAPDEAVAVRLRVKGPRAWLWRGDEPVAGPLPLAERRRPAASASAPSAALPGSKPSAPRRSRRSWPSPIRSRPTPPRNTPAPWR